MTLGIVDSMPPQSGCSATVGRVRIAEHPDRLIKFPHGDGNRTVAKVVEALKRDDVALIQGLDEGGADDWIANVASAMGLKQQLTLQAQFASVKGHRKNVGTYFMTVNERDGFQFVTAHSEGTRATGMQLAAFYCKENTTDGGVNILLNTHSESAMWNHMRELRTKVDLGGRKLSSSEVARARMMLGVNLPEDLLSPQDQVIGEQESPLPGTRLFKVLVPAKPSLSQIIGRPVNVLWNNVSSIDFDAGEEYLKLLQTDGLLKLPTGEADASRLDHEYPRALWRSGMRYESVFKAKLTCRLSPGEMVVMNNMTWAHSTSNWTPGSGVRDVRAAFA